VQNRKEPSRSTTRLFWQPVNRRILQTAPDCGVLCELPRTSHLNRKLLDRSYRCFCQKYAVLANPYHCGTSSFVRFHPLAKLIQIAFESCISTSTLLRGDTFRYWASNQSKYSLCRQGSGCAGLRRMRSGPRIGVRFCLASDRIPI